MRELTENQLLFAQWLAKPLWERSPRTHRELASIIGVTDRTLEQWQKLPEMKQQVASLNTDNLLNLIAPATALMEKAINIPGSVSRVSFDAAKYIVQDWAKRSQPHGSIMRTISDLYVKYHED